MLAAVVNLSKFFSLTSLSTNSNALLVIIYKSSLSTAVNCFVFMLFSNMRVYWTSVLADWLCREKSGVYISFYFFWNSRLITPVVSGLTLMSKYFDLTESNALMSKGGTFEAFSILACYMNLWTTQSWWALSLQLEAGLSSLIMSGSRVTLLILWIVMCLWYGLWGSLFKLFGAVGAWAGFTHEATETSSEICNFLRFPEVFCFCFGNLSADFCIFIGSLRMPVEGVGCIKLI